jgi:hypothetical protein
MVLWKDKERLEDGCELADDGGQQERSVRDTAPQVRHLLTAFPTLGALNTLSLSMNSNEAAKFVAILPALPQFLALSHA